MLTQCRNGFFLFSFCCIASACSINPTPEKAGLFDSIYHLSNNTYQQRKAERKKTLTQLMQHQTKQKIQLAALNKQLQQKHQQSTKENQKLQNIQQQQKQTQQQLSAKHILYTANKNKHRHLQQQSKKLDKDIEQEKSRTHRKYKIIQSLRTKRDALRKELFLQTEL